MRSRFYTNDTFDWSIDVKLKLKVGVCVCDCGTAGVVSVTVKQHAEVRLRDSQSMLDRCVA